MKRARLLGALILLAAASCSRSGSVFRGAPVVVICVDTLRADRLPAYGYRKVETPAWVTAKPIDEWTGSTT